MHQTSVAKWLAEWFVKLWPVRELNGPKIRGARTESSGHGSQRPKGLQVILVSSCSAAEVTPRSVNLTVTVR